MREVCYQVHAILQSGYRDSNSGLLAPKASALAKLSHTPLKKTSYLLGGWSYFSHTLTLHNYQTV